MVNLENKNAQATGSTVGGAVPYSPLREMLGYDPFRSFLPNFDPQIDVVRNDTGFEVEIPVAGFNASQIEMVVTKDILKISGKSERRSFSRSLQLPDDIDSRAIDASVENGLLCLKLRRHADAEPRRIEIKSAVSAS
jgi:HSP20 family molecular chaperone IbpA